MIKFLFKKTKNGKEEKESVIKRQADLDKKLVFSLSKSRFPTLGQMKYLPKYLKRNEKLLLTGLLFIFLASVVFLGARFFLSRTEIGPTSGGEYVEGLVGSPGYVNPILAQTNDVDMDLSRLVFSGLLKYNEKMELAPDLAEKYEISEDKKVFTFTLRENVRWHDGETLDVDDVIFTVASIQDPLFKSPLHSSFRGVTIEKVDDRTIRFKLAEAYAPFLGVLTFGILPEHIWYDIPAQSANLAEQNIKPIGSGPFEFKSLTKDKNGNIKIYTLARNKNFYGQEPFLDKLIFKFYPDYPSLLEALQNKNIEGIGFLPKEFQDSLEGKKIKKYLLNLPQYTAIFFNQKNSEVLKDAAVRKALTISLDKEKLIEETFGQDAEAIDSPILPGYIGYSTETNKNIFDEDAAKALLDESGFKFSEGVVRKKEEQVLQITLTTVDRPEYLKAAEFVKTSWEAIGAQVNLQIVSGSRIQREVIRPRAYEALMISTIVGFDPDPFSFWHSSQTEDPGLNLALYANRKADKLIEEARQTDSPEERTQKYLEFQNILAEDVPAAFLYSPRYAYFVSEEVRGIDISRVNVPSDRFAGVLNWYKKTARKWK